MGLENTVLTQIPSFLPPNSASKGELIYAYINSLSYKEIRMACRSATRPEATLALSFEQECDLQAAVPHPELSRQNLLGQHLACLNPSQV